MTPEIASKFCLDDLIETIILTQSGKITFIVFNPIEPMLCNDVEMKPL